MAVKPISANDIDATFKSDSIASLWAHASSPSLTNGSQQPRTSPRRPHLFASQESSRMQEHGMMVGKRADTIPSRLIGSCSGWE
ncbi:hypothetical protein KC330_g110 [Hortaea werneckii]|nr:hypothetical protein KC330_g110 [Hortaea werneckii]